MKKFLLVFILLSVIVSNAQIVGIPDPNFKAALLAFGIDLNGDGEIQVSEAESAGAIVADNSNISDLTGIEAFVNINQLYLSFNNLTSIDVSKNTKLVELLVEFNELESLNVSNNDKLLWLWFTGNNVLEIELSNNPDIQILWASNNQLETIDVSQIPSLASLSLGNNQITSLDVSNNPNLSHLTLEAGNMLTELDLSNNPLLCTVVVGNNNLLEYINLKNGGNTLLVEGNTCYYGSGTSNSILIATNNPVLETICVDNVPFAQTNFQHIPSQTVFIDDCLLGADEFESLDIKIYPNPTSDNLNIEAKFEIKSVAIFNVLGQSLLFHSGTGINEIIDVSALSSGNYFVRIESNGEFGTYQLLKD